MCAEKHYLRALPRGPGAIANVVNDVRASAIKLPDRGRVVIGDDPTLSPDARLNKFRDVLVVICLVKVIVEIAAFDVVGRVQIYQRLLGPLGSSNLQELER